MINIAIDGPSGAGKSTVARAVAEQTGFIYLDTGAMYRATAYYALSQGIDVCDEKSVSEMLDKMNMEIAYIDGAQQIFVNNINTTPYLREHRMSKAASDISALPCVRYKLVDLQRQFAQKHNVVLDGRDIGTFVLPNANCKIFMTATPEERAKRRCIELAQKGETVEFETVLADIKQRDYNDSHREVAPLKQAEDAELLDTTNMTVEQVVEYVKNKVDGILKTSVDEHKPMTKKQIEKLRKYYKVRTHFGFYRFMRFLLLPLAKFLWPTKIVNADVADKVEGAALFMCNHYTKIDALIPLCRFFKKEPHVLAKAELFLDPMQAWFHRRVGSIPVRRGEADMEAVKCVLKVLKDGKRLLIFPEGTRNKQGTQVMGEIKNGTARFAIKTKAMLVPMLYYAPPKLFRKNWLYIGEPFTLEEFYNDRTPNAHHNATEVIKEHFAITRKQLNEYVEAQKGKKK